MYFYDFISLFTPKVLFRLRRCIKHSRQCFISYPNTKILCYVSCFKLSSRCLDIAVKLCLSYLIHYARNASPAMVPACYCSVCLKTVFCCFYRKDLILQLWEQLLELLKRRRSRLEKSMKLQRCFQEMINTIDWMDEIKVCR